MMIGLSFVEHNVEFEIVELDIVEKELTKQSVIDLHSTRYELFDIIVKLLAIVFFDSFVVKGDSKRKCRYICKHIS
jgi:hypothetical protein